MDDQAPADSPIKIIESMIMYYINNEQAKQFLRNLLSADPQKYQRLLDHNVVEMPELVSSEE